jgi:stalled ribosome rescue protein Dom34
LPLNLASIYQNPKNPEKVKTSRFQFYQTIEQEPNKHRDQSSNPARKLVTSISTQIKSNKKKSLFILSVPPELKNSTPRHSWIKIRAAQMPTTPQILAYSLKIINAATTITNQKSHKQYSSQMSFIKTEFLQFHIMSKTQT